MAFKLKTSKNTDELLSRIERSEGLPWYVLVKLAISLSIRAGKLQPDNFKTDSNGKELNRQTITSDSDKLFKCLIEFVEERHISDDEFFPKIVKAHIDRGAILLDQEQRYGTNFLVHLTELDKGI